MPRVAQENRLGAVGPLQPDVEPQAVLVAVGDQGVAPLGGQRSQQRVVGQLLARAGTRG